MSKSKSKAAPQAAAPKVQYSVVDQVPLPDPRPRHSMWDEVIAAVPEEGALKVECANTTQANSRAHALRKYLASREIAGYLVTKVSDAVYIKFWWKEGDSEAEGQMNVI